MKLVGRTEELQKLTACLKAAKNVLLEGPVGVGKTHLALSLVEKLKKKSFRIDGDSRYTEQKLAGWFDPPLALKKGFGPASFIAGPLTAAMKSGAILFINELNRLPEGVQNVLLPAIDEGVISIPRMGVVKAKPGFCVVATQNPKEFVATSHLSEAILDRFELVLVDYQSEVEEIEIVHDELKQKKIDATEKNMRAAVLMARLTRNHPRVRRGASVRAAMSIAELTVMLEDAGLSFEKAFFSAVMMALPTRVELERDADSGSDLAQDFKALVEEWSKEVFDALSTGQTQQTKKKF